MEQSENNPAEVVNAAYLLAKLRKRYPHEPTLRRISRLSRSTIRRIDEGEDNFDALTLGKLVKALNA